MHKKITQELNSLKKEKYQGIMPLLLLLTIIFLFLFKSGDLSADYSVSPFPNLSSEISAESNKWDISAPYLINGSWRQQEVIRNAWDISHDKEFILTLKAENGTFEPQRKSNGVGSNGHWDHGLCQLNYQWHKPFIDSEDFNVQHKQLEYCYAVYQKRPGAFYGYYRRWEMTKFFKFK